MPKKQHQCIVHVPSYISIKLRRTFPTGVSTTC